MFGGSGRDAKVDVCGGIGYTFSMGMRLSLRWPFSITDLRHSILLLGLLLVVLTSLASDGDCRLAAVATVDVCGSIGLHAEGAHPHLPSMATLPVASWPLVALLFMLLCLVPLGYATPQLTPHKSKSLSAALWILSLDASYARKSGSTLLLWADTVVANSARLRFERTLVSPIFGSLGDEADLTNDFRPSRH